MSNFNKIFCVGLSRTGTHSLANALTKIGFPCIHFGDISRIDSTFRAISDTPCAARYKELDIIYPDSKFILTVRDVDKWIESCKYLLDKHPPSSFGLKNKFEYSWCNAKLYKTVDFNEKLFRKAYADHINDVKEYFSDRPNDLMIIDITKNPKWDDLCEFLNVDIPKDNFPHKNKRT